MASVSALKLVQIRYFVAIVEAGSFVAAARELDVAQPALSRQIIILEQELDKKLLRRVRRGATPTSAGKRFYVHARSVLDQLELAISDVQQGSKAPSGEVRVALSVGSASMIGPKLVQRMGTRFPDVVVSIVDGLGYQTGDVIESAQVSFGLVAHAEALSGARVQSVLEENLFLVSKRKSDYPDISDIAFKDIVGMDLVMPDRRVHLRRMVEEAASRSGHKLTVRYEQQSLLTILSLVREGLGSVIIGWPAIHSMWVAGSIDARCIVEPELSRIISLAIPSSRPLSNAAKVTYDTLHELLREEVKEGNWKGELLSG
ncbi:MAG: LysR family nitrogen assimilation transcriptional regulator [bacterium]|jgi:LysR family nitrogen assimilation transcriptional regulator